MRRCSELVQGEVCARVTTQSPLDSGFGAKANAGVKACDRDYVLISCDDFDVTKPGTIEGIQRMVTVLDNDPSVGIASGRVNNVPYEGFLTRHIDEKGQYLVESRLPQYPHPSYMLVEGVAYAYCDLTVNYSLIRREVFDYVKWDEVYRIGGDHATFMMDVKDAGFKIAFVHNVNIKTIPSYPGNHPDYGKYRARATRALPVRTRQFPARKAPLVRLGSTALRGRTVRLALRALPVLRATVLFRSPVMATV